MSRLRLVTGRDRPCRAESTVHRTATCRISAMGDGRTGVTTPQPHHLDRYRDEPRSGDDADDHIVREHGYGDAEDDADTS